MKWADGKPAAAGQPKQRAVLALPRPGVGRAGRDDQKLFEMLILESFQAGLSWACVLNEQGRFPAGL